VIDLDGPPACRVCGTTVTVNEWREDDEHGWWWWCPRCGLEDSEPVTVRPSYRTSPATAALAAELTELRERLANGGDRVV
jgi:hypothetical protein